MSKKEKKAVQRFMARRVVLKLVRGYEKRCYRELERAKRAVRRAGARCDEAWQRLDEETQAQLWMKLWNRDPLVRAHADYVSLDDARRRVIADKARRARRDCQKERP